VEGVANERVAATFRFNVDEAISAVDPFLEFVTLTK
jgi:hypothetical protein